jgi:hypothetical protein
MFYYKRPCVAVVHKNRDRHFLTSGFCKITFRTVICLSTLTRTHGLPSRPYLITIGLLSLKLSTYLEVEEGKGIAESWLTPVKKPSTHMREGSESGFEPPP